MSRIDAPDIQGGIGLCIACLLSLLEDSVIRRSMSRHFRKYIIAGAVDNAVNLTDVIGNKSLGDRPNNGNAPGHTGLKTHLETFLQGLLKDLYSMIGQKGLVGRHHMLSTIEGLQ